MNSLRINDLVNRLYFENNLTDWDVYDSSMYYYVEHKLSQYEVMVGNLSLSGLSINSDDIFFKGKLTKSRLYNLIRRLKRTYLHILQSCYKGDFFYSSLQLYDLLLGRKVKLNQYLIEPYINYFDFVIFTDAVFYRMRDEESGKDVNDCSHVPYNLRNRIDSNRYSLQGLPCLYLADSKDTADKEIGMLKSGRSRWVSEFSPKKTIFLFDLRFRSVSFNKQLDEYDLFKLIITYPLRFLCSLKVKEEGSFHEEYYIPQLLSHLILIYLKEHPEVELYHGSEGILFDSTKNKGGYNLIIPASYKEKTPLKSGHSPLINNMFQVSKPVVFK